LFFANCKYSRFYEARVFILQRFCEHLLESCGKFCACILNVSALYIEKIQHLKTDKENCENMSELPEKQVKRLKALISEAETNIAAAKELLMSILGEDDHVVTPTSSREDVSGKVVEGVFDGQKMAGPDGKEYPVPANYASKSKLVEGDILKLTIADDGSFIYKQIGPIDRTQVIGTLVQHDGAYYVEANGREYRILLASVTYFRINVGDQVTIIIPTDNPEATWAAVEAAL
jgi:hypothetical protein